MIREHDCIVLTEDLPATGLKAGDIGTWCTYTGTAPATKWSS
jgi:hypothetical protein